MCPHATTYVSSYCYIYVLILLCMCPHTAIYVSSYCCICVLILLYVCPHTTRSWRSLRLYRASMYPSANYYMCVLILLYMSPHTPIYVSSYSRYQPLSIPQQTAIYVSSRSYISSGLKLLYVSSCYRCWRSSRLYRASIYPSTTSTRTTRARWPAPSAIAFAHSTFSTLSPHTQLH